MNTQLNNAVVAAQRSTPRTPRPLPPRQPTLLHEAAPLLSIAVAVAGLIALGATAVSA